jgi:O-antigen/teichoic acid export membrane protein
VDFLLNRMHSPLAHRLVDPASLAFLLGTAPLNAIAFGQAMYLRAHKQEKFLLNSVLGAVLVGGSTLVLGKFYGVRGVVVGSFASGLLVGLPMGTYTFAKYRRLWHAS